MLTTSIQKSEHEALEAAAARTHISRKLSETAHNADEQTGG